MGLDGSFSDGDDNAGSAGAVSDRLLCGNGRDDAAAASRKFLINDGGPVRASRVR